MNTRVLGTMVNVCGKRFIHDLLKPFVARVVDERLSFEVRRDSRWLQTVV